jgi:tetratricopeptide (TPR) repeat protein
MRHAALQAALAVTLSLSAVAPTFAWAADVGPATPTAAQQKAIDKQEAKDRKIVEKAIRVSNLAQLEPMIPDLQRVVANAPAQWPMVDRQSATTVIRLNDNARALTVLLLVAAAEGEAAKAAKSGDSSTSAVTVYNTYGLAAFLLGSHAVEMRQPEEAITWLDRGLAFQPDNLMLVTEKGSALTLQHRFADAVALYDAQPPRDALLQALDPGGEARLLRARGFSLIELNRLDEAETAYKQALALEPDHGGAKAELDYIRQLKAGTVKPQPADVMTGDKAKAYKPS